MAETVGDVWEPSRLGFRLGTAPEGTIDAQHWLGTDQYRSRPAHPHDLRRTQTTILHRHCRDDPQLYALAPCLGLLGGCLRAAGSIRLMSRFVDLDHVDPVTLILALVVLSAIDVPVSIPVLVLVMGLLDSTRVLPPLLAQLPWTFQRDGLRRSRAVCAARG